jgi:anti-sigma28 factor (negative regulator of flagellin synthesis)
MQKKAVYNLFYGVPSKRRQRSQSRDGWLADLREEFAAGTYYRDEGEIAAKVIQEYMS